MTWQDLLKRTDIVGGDLESHEDGRIFRGPISEIGIKEGHFYIKCEWCAVLTENSWVSWMNNNDLTVNTNFSKPFDIGSERVKFELPFLGFCIIFPKGGSKLDISKVKKGGLDVSV